jgi:hypothetical protein
LPWDLPSGERAPEETTIMTLRPLLLALCLPAAALAQEAAAPPPAPSADEINKVTTYYLTGKDAGPILIDFRLCGAIGKNAEGKNVCENELGDAAAKGDQLNAFVRFFAPRGGKYEDLKVRFLLDGEVRTTSDFTVSESWTGYTNYKRTTMGKAGTWEVEVVQGDKVLAKKKVAVR